MPDLRKIMVMLLMIVAAAVVFLTLSMRNEGLPFKKSRKSKCGSHVGSDHTKSQIQLRKPNSNLLSKLSEHYRLVEVDTDPLGFSPQCKRNVFLILMVVSAPDGYIRRNAIRGTWAQSYFRHKHGLKQLKSFKEDEVYELTDVVKTVFLIGHSNNKNTMTLVETEARTYGDVVIGGLHENYRNLTMKTRLGLKWAYYHCQAKYILKTDDDVFINPVPLIEWLKVQSRTKFYSGWCNFNSPVVRDPNNKWYISEEDYAGRSYPGYCLGGGYLMSDDVLGRILEISYGRKLFPMEDLYVGLMVRDLGDVSPLDNKIYFNLVFSGVTGCAYNKLYLAHSVRPNDQLKMLLEAEYAQMTC